MIKTFYILPLLFLLKCWPSQTQTGSEMFLSDEELKGGITTRHNIYDGPSLWGYINGGADVYLEYGFQKVFVQEIRFNKTNYKVEIYHMKDVESAFGIFTVSTFQCNTIDLPGSIYYCETNYQIQLARSDKYISITNDSGKPESVKYNLYLANLVKRKTDSLFYAVPALFQHPVFQKNLENLVLTRGELGLQNGYAFWTDKFSSTEGCTLTILPINLDEGKLTVSIMEFTSTDRKSVFLRQNDMQLDVSNTGTRNAEHQNEYWWSYGKTKLIYLESGVPENSIRRYIEIIEEYLGELEVRLRSFAPSGFQWMHQSSSPN